MARPKKGVESPPTISVSKEEFDSFKLKVEATQDRMLGYLEQMVNKQAEGNKPRNVMMATGGATAADGTITSTTTMPEDSDVQSSGLERLPAKYQGIFEKYFDPEDGFIQASLEGTDFQMIVPPKFSNATEAHKKFYKVDIRRKVLPPHDIAGGLETYLKLVARNLKYNRQIRLK